MIKSVERMGERLLARVLPTQSARAGCIPQTYCSYCGSGVYKRIWIYADCSWDSSACADPWDGC